MPVGTFNYDVTSDGERFQFAEPVPAAFEAFPPERSSAEKYVLEGDNRIGKDTFDRVARPAGIRLAGTR